MASEYANATDSTSVGELKLLGNFTVTDNDATWIASLMPLGALFGGMYLAKGMGRKDNSFVVYKVKQNLGKQVLRIPCPKFRSPSSSFVVFIHGQRDLSSLPWIGGAAVQIS